MRIIYFGSPEFAVPPLQAIAADPVFEIALVVTQGARGLSPVERTAQALHLPTYKPDSLRLAAEREPLLTAKADVFVVAAFGLILGRRTLNIPALGSVNLHPSLLPRYRGASPIMAAIESGDEETGVSLMVMDVGIDTGPVISQDHAVVYDNDTSESLSQRLSQRSAVQAVRDIPRWTKGELVATPQVDNGTSLTRTLTKADGWIDWRRPAETIERHVRAMWPWPRAWTTVDDSPLQIHAARVVDDDPGLEPGNVKVNRRRIIVGCGDGALELLTVEPAGRRAMTATAYLNGRRLPLMAMGQSGEPAPQPPLITPL
jgi:methionyl-tRNA formyltransferase